MTARPDFTDPPHAIFGMDYGNGRIKEWSIKAVMVPGITFTPTRKRLGADVASAEMTPPANTESGEQNHPDEEHI